MLILVFNYGESREISLGLIYGQNIIVVVHTDRNGITRIISARRADKKERKRYNEYIERAFR